MTNDGSMIPSTSDSPSSYDIVAAGTNAPAEVGVAVGASDVGRDYAAAAAAVAETRVSAIPATVEETTTTMKTDISNVEQQLLATTNQVQPGTDDGRVHNDGNYTPSKQEQLVQEHVATVTDPAAAVDTEPVEERTDDVVIGEDSEPSPKLTPMVVAIEDYGTNKPPEVTNTPSADVPNVTTKGDYIATEASMEPDVAKEGDSKPETVTEKDVVIEEKIQIPTTAPTDVPIESIQQQSPSSIGVAETESSKEAVDSKTDAHNETGENNPSSPPPPATSIADSVQMTATATTTSSSAADNTPISQTKGAQILMNRFSSWKATANERAVTLLKTQAPVLEDFTKQEYFTKFSTRFPSISRSSAASSTVSESTGKEDDDNAITSASLSPASSTKKNAKTKEGKNTSLHRPITPGRTASLMDNDDDVDHASDDDDHSDVLEEDSEDETSDVSGVETASGTGTDHTRSSATYGESTLYTTERMRAVLSRASVAGSVVAETMATGFRGRYTGDILAIPTKGDDAAAREPSPESQIQLIMKSRAAEHMQEILDQLEDHEYAMLLGRGMLGVNLKQCFLKNHGIYVDYLVEGGQAQHSGLIRSGDLPIRLGESDFRKGTIKDVPLEIGQAKRPAVLVLATGTKVPAERINYVDIAVAMMHRARKKHSKRKGTNDVGGMGEKPPTSQHSTEPITLIEKEEKTDDLVSASSPNSVCSVDIPVHDTIDSYRSPPGPSLELVKEFVDESPLRCLDKFDIDELRDIVDLDKNFRAALRNAFLLCALDGRRLSFLSKHFSNDVKLSDDDGTKKQSDVMADDMSNSMAPSAQMMLFLELSSFLDMYDVTPVDHLRESAKRIAYKFFLPTKIGTGLQPPLFDFHHIVPDSSLRHLEAVLGGKSKTIPRDLFLDFQRSVVDSLSASPFLSFLMSAECARMRAYLRDTSPYVSLPLKTMIDTISEESYTASEERNASAVGAKNCFAYIILYLVCKMEKDAMGEYDFGIEKETNRRLPGAPNDLCCVVFVRRTLLPLLEGTRKQFEKLKPDKAFAENDCKKLIHALEQLWDLWIGDTIDLSSRPTSTSNLYEKVRNTLSTISEEIDRSDRCIEKFTEAVLKSTLTEDVTRLVDELLLEYASTVHTNFRDHKFHEWMCSELNKVSLSINHQWSTNKASIPMLPQGCIKRLLRKAELPESVSLHKPYKANATQSVSVSKEVYHNADWAVVFGSSVGAELASQMAVPGLESLDVRRYTCLPVSPDVDFDYDEFRPETVLPATFEGYAVVPPSKTKPFAQIFDEGRVSVDGWQVSLVTFTIPNAGSSTSGDDSESSLYGVSLCLNRMTSNTSPLEEIIDPVNIELVEEKKSTDEDLNWKSPIRFEVNDSETQSRTKFVRKVSVSSNLPILNSHLKDQSWEDRLKDDQYREQSNPPVIGIALVSRRNVVLSMRETLSKLLFDYARGPDQSLEDVQVTFTCQALVNMLGAFSYQDHEASALKIVLEPYIRSACSSWVDRPLTDQSRAFETFALKQLTDALPPTPLALIFVTALLEQKIIISSSRRSVLHAACSALVNLLRPLKWSHLLVPLVPGALAADLIQYPAPFLLGVPSEDADNMNLLGYLPRDVTLVDLDVGRVILAPSFGQDNEMVRKAEDTNATARALRSQALYLAQGLGTVFGNSLRPRSWQCDNPLLPTNPDSIDSETRNLVSLKNTASSFIMELLEGTASCCYWIEEATQGFGTSAEPSVLFDEDKFFEIKNHRATKAWKPLFLNDNHKASTGAFALSLADFDLILESLLRTQAFSLHVSSSPKTEMLYY